MPHDAHSAVNPNYKWVILVVIWLVYFAFGIVYYSIPPLVTPIAHDLSLTYTQMGFILGTAQLVYVPLALPIGLLIDRVGTRRAIMAGAALVSLSGLLRSVATNFETLFLSVSIFGVGGPIISVGLPKIVASWFHGKHRGIASGIYITGAMTGTATALAITNTLIMPYVGTWRNTLALYGIFGFLTALLWLLFGRETTHNQSGQTATRPLREATKKLLKQKYVWIVAIIGFSSFFAGHGFGGWLPKLLELKGMNPAEAGFLASLPGWCGLIGSATIPGLRKTGSRKPLLFVVLLVQGICIFAIGTAIGLPLIASLVLYGISSRATTPLLMVILMDMPQIGAEYMGAAAGIFFSIGEIGGFAGPFIVGFLVDLTGSILPSIIALSTVVEAMLIFTLLMKEK